jgi:anti-sigma factor RsiW
MAPSNGKSIEEDAHLLVHAYLDGELDVASGMTVERMIEADPAIASQAENIHALRTALRSKFPLEALPPHLKLRIEALAGTRTLSYRPTWTLMAASLMLAVALSSSSTWLALQQAPASNVLTGELIDSHLRSLIASTPTDVASSDRHTVKPWFSGKVAQSPKVVDLSAEGYPLVGGRVDVFGKLPVPTLVYNRRRHVISVTAVPLADGKNSPIASSVNGYNILRWNDGGISYWAVSDLNLSELNTFAKLFQQ